MRRGFFATALAFAGLAMPVCAEPGGWRVECGAEGCRSTSEVLVQEGGPRLKLWIGATADGHDYIGVMTPLGVHVRSGVSLSLDGGKTAAAALQIVDCATDGCRAVAPLAVDLRAQLGRIAEATIVVRDARTRQIVGFKVPMRGFADSLAALELRRG